MAKYDALAKYMADASTKKLLIGAGIGLGVIFFVVNPLLEALGLKDSAEDKDRDKADLENATSPTSPFSPLYYKSSALKGKTITLITKANAQAFAKKIYDSLGYFGSQGYDVFGDNEDAVYAVFRQLTAQTQVSWLADVFNQMYGQDMYTYISKFMNNDEIKIVNGIVAKMKPY